MFTRFVAFILGLFLLQSCIVKENNSTKILNLRRYENGDIKLKRIPTATIDAGITALVVDPSGTVYMGGSFTSVNSKTNMAHIAYSDVAGWHPLDGGAVSSAPNIIAINSSSTNAGKIYVGGAYSSIAGKPGCIAMWDPVEKVWYQLGQGLVGTVNTIAFDSAGNVYAGGEFQDGLDTPGIQNIAKWDGTNWTAMGTDGLASGAVNSIVVDSSDTVYAGGAFTGNMAKFAASTWLPVGTTGPNKAVKALAVDGINVYAGGSFDSVDSVPDTNYVAMWDGAVWHSLDNGLDGTVNAMMFKDGELYVRGAFQDAIAKYSDGKWKKFVSLSPSQSVNTFAFDDNNRILLGVNTALTDGPVNYLRIFNNKHVWNDVGGLTLTSANNNASSITIDSVLLDGADVYIGGNFINAGGNANCDRICKWDGNRWTSLAAGIPNGYIKAMVVKGKYLYVGGNFTSVGNWPASYIARWDGASWEAVVDSDSGTIINNTMFTLAADDSMGPYIYAGGNFNPVRGTGGMAYIARFNTRTSTWSRIGAGRNSSVYSLSKIGQTLYAGGGFADKVASWNGSTWTALSTGLPVGTVQSLAADNSGNLYAGGSFFSNDGPNFIAKWSVSSWSALAGGMVIAAPQANSVFVLALSGTALYAAGAFTNVGGSTDTDKIAKIDLANSTWNALDGGFAGGLLTGVNAIAVSDEFDKVYAAGNFLNATNGDNTTAYMAVYEPIGFVPY